MITSFDLETEFIITQALACHPLKAFRKACSNSKITLTEHREIRRLEILTHDPNYRQTIKEGLKNFAEILSLKLNHLDTAVLFFKQPDRPIQWVAEVSVKTQALLPRPKLKLWGEK